jgi:hypothetical protein
MAAAMLTACSEEKTTDTDAGTTAASALVTCLTAANANLASCASSIDTAKLPHLSWLFSPNPTPPAGFSESSLTEYEKAFYEVLKNSQDAMNKAGITIPDVGGSSESSFSKDESGTPILTIDALPADVMQAITASGTTKVSIYGRVHGTDTWLGGDTSSIAQTPITIRFPAEVRAEYLKPLSTFIAILDGDTDNHTVNPPDAKYVIGEIVTTTNSSARIYPNCLRKHVESTDRGAGEEYWYVDKDVSISGNYKICSSSACDNIITITFDLTLKTGWNIVFLEGRDHKENYTQTPPSSINPSWKFIVDYYK